MSLTVLVDYDSGNLHSAEKAFQRMAQDVDGGEVMVTSRPEDVARADRIVLPGDGAFPACRAALGSYGGLYEAIAEAVTVRARPFLGICVGMQMLFDASDEDPTHAGLGVIPGRVVAIPDTVRRPQMQWNELHVRGADPILAGLPAAPWVYFVHSYAARPADPSVVVATCDYGVELTAVVRRGNVVATPFHPEKSGDAGLALLRNWLETIS